MNNFRRRVSSAEERGFGDPITGRGYIGNYEAVNLGLPSGLLWATWNVGATKETAYGNYYLWGAGNKPWNNNAYHTVGTDSSYTLPSSADIATQVMGEGWKMPTSYELRDLIDKTDYSFVTNFKGSGVNCGKFTSKTNPNAYVFFPAAGIYYNGTIDSTGTHGLVWSSTPNSNYYSSALRCYSDSCDVTSTTARVLGISVRGVHAAV